MKKIFSLIAAAFVAITMMAQDVTLDFTVDNGIPTDKTVDEGTYTVGGYAVKLAGSAGNGYAYYAENQYVLFGKSGAYLELPAFDFSVSKIEFVGRAGASASTGMNVFVGDNAVSTATTGSTGTNTYMIAAAHQAAGTIYRIKVTTGHNAQVTAVKVYAVVAGAPAAPEFSIPGGTYQGSQEVTLSCATEGATIYYTTDGTEPTAQSASYTAPLSVEQTMTVKAVAIKDGVASAVVSQAYSIVNAEGAGTQENPFTVADVKALNNSLSGKQWVVGTIVGCYASNNQPVVDPTALVATNLAIATGADTIPVALPSGAVRDALNVADHVNNLGHQVKLHGDLTTYFSTTGVRNVDDYEFVGGAPLAAATFEDVELADGAHVLRPAEWVGGANSWTSGAFTFFTYDDATYAPAHYYYDVQAVNYAGGEVDPDYSDAYLATAAECGAAEGGLYAVWQDNAWNGGNARITFSAVDSLSGVALTNTHHVEEAILNGMYPARAFAQDDYLKVTITGYLGEISTGSVDFYLADFRTAGDWKYAKNWQWVSLTSLGRVDGLTFAIEGTDTGEWGMNTPAYFCFDNLGGAAAACTLGEMTAVSATALENVKAVETTKFIQNGQLIILKNGLRYNAQGIRF